MLTVLFLCTANSARSIMAEAIMNRMGGGRFRALSAGSSPRGAVHAEALRLLERMDHPTEDLRSKSWDEFSGPDAPAIDFIFTLCDSAAAETCPVWPGHPISAHWGLPDPAAEAGGDAMTALAFADCYRMLEQRIGIFVNLPLDALDRMTLQSRLEEIGRTA